MLNANLVYLSDLANGHSMSSIENSFYQKNSLLCPLTKKKGAKP